MANAKQVKAALALMAAIVAATEAGNAENVAVDSANILVEKGFAEVNPNGPNGDGTVATRATAAGIESVKGTATVAEAAKPSFELETGVEMPAAKRTGRSIATSIYPFDKMEVGQSFFIPATDKKPEPAKSLASTVSSATARYAVKLTNEDGSPKMVLNRKKKEVQATQNTRVFVVREAEKDGVKGARIFRTA